MKICKTLLVMSSICILFANISVSAAKYVATDVRIIKVSNTTSDSDNKFLVWVTGEPFTTIHTDPNTIDPNTQSAALYIQFSFTGTTAPERFKRAYAAALVALTNGLKVNIFNSVDDTMDNANTIEIISN